MISQSQETRMRQKLTKQQILVSRLLELSSENLELEINKEIEENPFLEQVIEDTSPSTPNDNDNDNDSDAAELIDPNNEYYTHNSYDYDDYKVPKGGDNDTDATTFQQADSCSFQAALLEQLHLKQLTDREIIIGTELIGNIDESGYMSRNINVIVDDLAIRRYFETTEQEVEDVLKIIQTFEPAGVAARNLQECLSIQLSRLAYNNEATISNAKLIIDKNFDDFANKRFEKICKQLKITEEELQQAINLIRTLNPKPCDGNNDTAQTIIPDFYVFRNGNQMMFNINERNLPKLRIDQQLIDRLRKDSVEQNSRRQHETQMFIEQHSKDATSFISAINQRYQTLQLTMSAILKFQQQYFTTGDISDLKPMAQKDIAKITGLDFSVISRVVNQKYVHTEHGVFLLKDLFSNALPNVKGPDVTTKEIKSEIKKYIDNEDKNTPLADEDLRQMLEDNGYTVARRTVAKYREALGIPTARLRKEL